MGGTLLRKPEARRRLAEAQNWRCCYCGVDLSPDQPGPTRATCEHLIPESHGGYDTASNLVVACEACNRVRADGSDAFLFAQCREKLMLTGQWPAGTFADKQTMAQARSSVEDLYYAGLLQAWLRKRGLAGSARSRRRRNQQRERAS